MFFGGKELILFEGVVEDRQDPLFLGRVRVRAIGFHDADKQKMPTDSLPWAIPLLPPNGGGDSLGYKEGDFVAGYFRDGEAKQFPVVLGMMPGIPEAPANPEFGFADPTPKDALEAGKIPRPPEMIPPPSIDSSGNLADPPSGKYDDPNKLPVESTSTGQLQKFYGKLPFPFDLNGDGKFDISDVGLILGLGGGIAEAEEADSESPEIEQHPISRYPLENRLKESSISRLARNEKIDQTLVARKRGSLVTSPIATHVSTGVGSDASNDGETIGEPTTPFAAKYPYNHVYESESGHVVEYDDTPSAERVHVYHRSGTFREIHPDGKQVDKSVHDRYDLSLGHSNYAAERSINVTAKESLKVLGKEAVVIESGGVMSQDSGSDRNVSVGGNSNTKIKGDAAIVIDGDVSILIKGNLSVKVEGDTNLSVEGEAGAKVKKDLKLFSGSDMMLKADGDYVCGARNTILSAMLLNTLRATGAVVTEGPLTFFKTLLTDGTAIRALYADFSNVPFIPPIIPKAPPLPPYIKLNKADSQASFNLPSSSSFSPKEGYILNGQSVVGGSVQSQDLYKPQSDSDGKVVVLSKSLGQRAKLYQAIPTGQLEDAKLQYKHKNGKVVEWDVKRLIHKKGKLIESGVYKGNGNGGRDHWRFTKSGDKYPSPMILQIGKTEYLIVESIARHEAL